MAPRVPRLLDAQTLLIRHLYISKPHLERKYAASESLKLATVVASSQFELEVEVVILIVGDIMAIQPLLRSSWKNNVALHLPQKNRGFGFEVMNDESSAEPFRSEILRRNDSV